jgi:hypothetical protein
MRVYDSMPRKTCLIQTIVDPTVLRKLDALAKATGHKRASYLRHLVETHVKAVTPRLATTIGIFASSQNPKL